MLERSTLRSLGLLALFCGSSVLAESESAATGKVESVETSVCRLIESSARTQSLPVAFLTRLIWQESSFRPDTISPAGAQGIAQFMPKTAYERGLANPFDPEEAIPKSAELLADLKQRFGNLGLAAAAYNGYLYTTGQNVTTAGTVGYLFGGAQSALEIQYVGNGVFLPLSHEGTIRAF